MQLVKGCEIAMHNGAVLARENSKLRVQLARKQAKQARPSRWVASNIGMTVERSEQQMMDDQLDVEVENGGEAGPSSAVKPTNQRDSWRVIWLSFPVAVSSQRMKP
jgi:hypothetical protein